MEFVNKVYSLIDNFREMLHFPRMNAIDFVMIFCFLGGGILYNLIKVYFGILYKIHGVKFDKNETWYQGFDREKKIYRESTNNSFRRYFKIGLFFTNFTKPLAIIGFVFFVFLVLRVVFKNIL